MWVIFSVPLMFWKYMGCSPAFKGILPVPLILSHRFLSPLPPPFMSFGLLLYMRSTLHVCQRMQSSWVHSQQMTDSQPPAAKRDSDPVFLSVHLLGGTWQSPETFGVIIRRLGITLVPCLRDRVKLGCVSSILKKEPETQSLGQSRLRPN